MEVSIAFSWWLLELDLQSILVSKHSRSNTARVEGGPGGGATGDSCSLSHLGAECAEVEVPPCQWSPQNLATGTGKQTSCKTFCTGINLKKKKKTVLKSCSNSTSERCNTSCSVPSCSPTGAEC